MKKYGLRIKVLTLALTGAMLLTPLSAQAGIVIDNSNEAEQTITSTTMYVGTRSLYLYEGASSSSESFAIPYMEELVVTDMEVRAGGETFIRVYYNNIGYYITASSKEENLVDRKSNPQYQGDTPYQQQVLDVARKILENWKTKYAHQSSNGIPDDDGYYGFDCSGLVSYVFNTAIQPRVPTYRLSSSIVTLYNTKGIYNEGYEGAFEATEVLRGTYEESKLQPGDVLFFNLYTEEDGRQHERGYNHCGIYIGNGEFIHASSSFGGGVRLMPMSGIYTKNFVCAKRYLPTGVKAASLLRYTKLTKTKIYAERSTYSKVVTRLEIETPVELLYTNNLSWAYVKLSNGKHGFVLMKNLSENIAAEQILCSTKDTTKLCRDFTIKKNYLKVTEGTEVTYVGRVGVSNYYEVLYQGVSYYIYAKDGISEKLTTAG
ncbi:MAG: C40 family peptidase [Lachnospiraceae bacterium]|nr:C40 family peptidase [Lachnospiraceae bacterium]